MGLSSSPVTLRLKTWPVSPNEEKAGSARLWRKSLQSEDPAGWWGIQRRPRRCHEVRRTDNHHPPAGYPPSRALRADLAHPGGEAGITPGAEGQEERETRPRQQQIRLAGHDSEKEATKTEGGRTQPIFDTRSRTGCPLTPAASLRQHVDRKGHAHFCLLRPGPAHSGGELGSRSWMADFTEQKGNTWIKRKNGTGGQGTGRPGQFYFFQKRINLKEEGNEFTNLMLH